MNTKTIRYFDHNATTPVAREVVESMLPYLTDYWGNPSSAYGFAHQIAAAVEEAREKVAGLIGAEPKEVIFTSCGTESNNTAIHSALAVSGKRHVVTTAVEHSATLKYCQWLEKRGYAITYLPVDKEGKLDLHQVEEAIGPETGVVSIMWANNETGVVFPVADIARICQSRNVLFHTDAVQVPGKLRIDVKEIGVDMLSLSAHKLNAPKGIGMLYVKKRTRFQPYIIGGHQERGRRGGTENVANIVAFGRAAEMAVERLHEENTRVRSLRDRMESELVRRIPHCRRNGAAEPRLPNTSNLSFDFVEAEAVLMLLDQVGICASSGSACTTGSLDPSHVLTAMGLSPMQARGSLRLSLGCNNTEDDVEYLLEHLPPIIQKLRDISPLNPQHPDNVGYHVASSRGRDEGASARLSTNV